MDIKPLLVVVAGVNGAGKTTLTGRFIFRKTLIINPDVIAKMYSCSIIEAGKVAVSKRNELLSKKKNFAIETTLAGNSEIKFMQEAKKYGYIVKLVYLGVDGISLIRARIVSRVSAGGHNVSEEDILRRYNRSLNNLPIALKIADKAYLIDNTQKYRLVCVKKNNQIILRSQDVPEWFKRPLQQMKTQAKKKARM